MGIFNLETDKQKLLALADEFAARGYTLVDHEFGLKLFPQVGHFPSIDILRRMLIGTRAIMFLAMTRRENSGPLIIGQGEELKEIVPYQFGPITSMGAKTTDRYLTTLYKKATRMSPIESTIMRIIGCTTNRLSASSIEAPQNIKEKQINAKTQEKK